VVPRHDDAPSRGTLVAEILRSEDDVPKVLAHLREVGPRYNGFNVIFSDGERLAVYESVVGAARPSSASIAAAR
jgi:uncharacterized protein with NRDE domain